MSQDEGKQAEGRSTPLRGRLDLGDSGRFPSSRSGRALFVGLIVAGLVACTQLWPSGPAERYERTEAVMGAGEAIGAEACGSCHGHQPYSGHHEDCESCHGSGSIHVQNVLLEENIRFPTSRECLDCHATGKANHVDWAASDHEAAGLLCSSCHDPHKRSRDMFALRIGFPRRC